MLVPKIHRRYQREGLRTVPRRSMRVQENRRRQSRDRVDDILLASKTKENEGRTLSDLRLCFKIKDLGEAEFYLGCHITRNREAKTLTFDQHIYCLVALLGPFHMQGS